MLRGVPNPAGTAEERNENSFTRANEIFEAGPERSLRASSGAGPKCPDARDMDELHQRKSIRPPHFEGAPVSVVAQVFSRVGGEPRGNPGLTNGGDERQLRCRRCTERRCRSADEGSGVAAVHIGEQGRTPIPGALFDPQIRCTRRQAEQQHDLGIVVREKRRKLAIDCCVAGPEDMGDALGRSEQRAAAGQAFDEPCRRIEWRAWERPEAGKDDLPRHAALFPSALTLLPNAKVPPPARSRRPRLRGRAVLRPPQLPSPELGTSG
jgi:hypothetical protein